MLVGPMSQSEPLQCVSTSSVSNNWLHLVERNVHAAREEMCMRSLAFL